MPNRSCLKISNKNLNLFTSNGLIVKYASKNFSQVKESDYTPSYTERQAKKGRPVSPHVTIYSFPIAAVSSISNRFAGVALSVGVTGIGSLALFGIDPSGIMSTIGAVPLLGQVAKFSVAFPLVYHYAASIRHFMWDRLPETLTNQEVERSSYILIGSATAISIIFAFVSI